ncbi:MAG: hypothetical protein PVH52_07975, partial [bacterium]
MRPIAFAHALRDRLLLAGAASNLAALILIPALTALFLLPPSAGAQTDVRLRVTAQGRAAIRICVLQLEIIDDDLKAYDEEFIKILKDDLEMSGYFELVDDPEK